MHRIQTILAVLASLIFMLVATAVFPSSANAQSLQPARSATSGYSLLRVPQPQTTGTLVSGAATVSPIAGKSKTNMPPAVRVPFPVPPKKASDEKGAKDGASQASQGGGLPYLPPAQRQKTRRMPLGW